MRDICDLLWLWAARMVFAVMSAWMVAIFLISSEKEWRPNIPQEPWERDIVTLAAGLVIGLAIVSRPSGTRPADS